MTKESLLNRFVGKCIGMPVSQFCDFIEQLHSDNSVLRTRIEELEAEVAGLKSMMMEFGSDCDCLSCGGQKLHDKLCVVGKIEQAIETPTGSKLLAKIEVGEKLATYVSDSISVYCKIHKDHYHGQCTCYEKFKLLSAYRATCEKEASK
jgi:hypothetical protein